MSKYNYILTPTKLTIVGKGKHLQINTKSNNFDKVKILLKDKKFDDIIEMFDVKTFVNANKNKGLELLDNNVLFNGEILNNTLTNRIIQFKNEGLDFNPLLKFLENQIKNPSKESVNDLYEFIEHGNMPITDDGCFLAYKYVNDNYYDCYTNTFDNHIGCICKMDRNMVNNDRTIACSNGLHVCTFDYLSNFVNDSNHIMIVKVNPKDVVSVPIDYHSAKMRCCEYEVVDEYTDYKSNSDKEFFNKICYDEYKLQLNSIYIINHYINDNLRKKSQIIITKIDNDEVQFKKTKGKKIYKLNKKILLKYID